MKITEIECHVLLDPDYDPAATSSSQDDLVVFVHTDEGIVGIGETDTNPWVARACIESPGTHTMGLGLKQMLIGLDPLDTESIWQRLYVGSAMTGRRGAGICALGAIDMALWDIKGKHFKQPCWKLLGGAQQPNVTPYASLQPAGSDAASYVASLVKWLMRAKELGFSAAKLEVTPFGPYAHQCFRGDDRVIIDAVARCREAVGSDFTLMLDVQYAWSDARRALSTLRQIEPYGLFFVETPIWIDDLDGYAHLHDHLGIPIAAGEWQNTRFEFADLMDRGKVDVVQPDVGRCGGLTEAMRICRMAQDRGRLIVPHCWKTLIGITASLHMAAAVPHCPFIEYLPTRLCDSALRRDLVSDHLVFNKGKIELPQRPGLGIDVNTDALRHFSRAASTVFPS